MILYLRACFGLTSNVMNGNIGVQDSCSRLKTEMVDETTQMDDESINILVDNDGSRKTGHT